MAMTGGKIQTRKCPVFNCYHMSLGSGLLYKHIKSLQDPEHVACANLTTICAHCGHVFKSPQGMQSHVLGRSCRKRITSRWWIESFQVARQFEFRFRQLQALHSHAANLLTFLHYSDLRRIPEILLLRLRYPRVKYTIGNTIECVAAPVVISNMDCISIEKLFCESIQHLISFGFIETHGGPLGHREFSIDNPVLIYKNDSSRARSLNRWTWLLAICHVFPGTFEDHKYNELARILLPFVKSAFYSCHDLHEHIAREPSSRDGLILTLVLSSNSIDNYWNTYALSLARELFIQSPPEGKDQYFERLRMRRSTALLSFQTLCHASNATLADDLYVAPGTTIANIEESSQLTTRTTPASLELSLYALICAIDVTPKVLLERAVMPQKRWDAFDVEYQADVRDFVLDPNVARLVCNSNEMWETVRCLLRIEAIKIVGSHGEQAYVRGPIAVEEYDHDTQSPYWIDQSFRLLFYAFPRNPTELTPREKKAFLTVQQDVFRKYSMSGFNLFPGDNVVELLLAICEASSWGSRTSILEKVDALITQSTGLHLQAEAIYQWSVVLRLNDDVEKSNEQLAKMLHDAANIAHLMSHPVLGRLRLSRAANYAYKFDFLSASEEARKWTPVDLTARQMDVAWAQILFVGRMVRGQGNFGEARDCFERCLGSISSLHQPKKHLVLSHLADTYVELNYLHRKEFPSNHTTEYLDKADDLIKLEVQRLRSQQLQSKGKRRLLLSATEIKIQRGQLVEAHELLIEICGMFERLTELDVVDRLGYLRALVALARISPSNEAEKRWMSALYLGRKHYPFEDDVWVVAIIHLFLCIAHFRQGKAEMGQAKLNYAIPILHSKSPQHLIPGIGTFLFDEAQSEIYSLSGLRLDL